MLGWCSFDNRCEVDFFIGTYTWTVPSGVSRVHFTVYGAQGGHWSSTLSPHQGLGGRATGELAVTTGESFEITVGGQGGPAGSSGFGVGGFPDGGDGGIGAGGGGGASSVRRDGIVLLVGGGGGGNTIVSAGGAGGGASGHDGDERDGQGEGGGGATPSGPGMGGAAGGEDGRVDGRGGAGSNNSSNGGGGGGGGGYYGGGGGGAGSLLGGGGGGGSGYAHPDVLDPALDSWLKTGDGLVRIAYPA